MSQTDQVERTIAKWLWMESEKTLLHVFERQQRKQFGQKLNLAAVRNEKTVLRKQKRKGFTMFLKVKHCSNQCVFIDTRSWLSLWSSPVSGLTSAGEADGERQVKCCCKGCWNIIPTKHWHKRGEVFRQEMSLGSFLLGLAGITSNPSPPLQCNTWK